MQNLSGKNKLFSWTRPQSIILMDNLGNTYKPGDNASDFYQSFQFSLNDGQTYSFESAYNAHAYYQLPVYYGPIASGASKLIVVFNGFGPFSGFKVSIDL